MLCPGWGGGGGGRVSLASRWSECSGIWGQTSKWSPKPSGRTQAGEETSRSGVEARHGMERSYGKAARFKVRAFDAAVGWVGCKKERFGVVKERVHPKRAFQLLPGERSGRERACTNKRVDGSGEGGEHRKNRTGFTQAFASSGRDRCGSADEG